MRTTVNINDELAAQAMAYTGITKLPLLLNEALQRLVQDEAYRRLAKLGGTQPDLTLPPRRRFE